MLSKIINFSIQKNIIVSVMATAMFFGVLAFATPAFAQTSDFDTEPNSDRLQQMQIQIQQLQELIARMKAHIANRTRSEQGTFDCSKISPESLAWSERCNSEETEETKDGIVIGSNVITTDKLSVRSGPGESLVQVVPKGTTGEVVGGPRTHQGRAWWEVRYEIFANVRNSDVVSGQRIQALTPPALRGWSAANWLKLSDGESDSNETIKVTGTLIAGVECTRIKTTNGQEYSLSRTGDFELGDSVVVTGTTGAIANKCMQGNYIQVTNISEYKTARECPDYQTPQCKVGEKIQKGELQSNGCYGPSQCVPANLSCPAYYPSCPSGQTVVSDGLNDRGCQIYKCSVLDPINRCPDYQEPQCREGYTVVKGDLTSNGCYAAPKCVLKNTVPVDECRSDSDVANCAQDGDVAIQEEFDAAKTSTQLWLFILRHPDHALAKEARLKLDKLSKGTVQGVSTTNLKNQLNQIQMTIRNILNTI